MAGRHCFVPSCPNNSRDIPDLLFVPILERLRKEWCHKVNAEYFKNYLQYCCEDHLNEEDIANYHQCKVMNKVPKMSSTAQLRRIPLDDTLEDSALAQLLLQKDTPEVTKKRKLNECTLPSTTASTLPFQVQKTITTVEEDNSSATESTALLNTSKGDGSTEDNYIDGTFMIVDPENLKKQDALDDVKPELDVMKLCRSCMTSLADHYRTRDERLLEMFSYCTNIQVDTNDMLPKSICDPCSLQIAILNAFIKNAREVDAKLKRIIENNNAGLVGIDQHDTIDVGSNQDLIERQKVPQKHVLKEIFKDINLQKIVNCKVTKIGNVQGTKIPLFASVDEFASSRFNFDIEANNNQETGELADDNLNEYVIEENESEEDENENEEDENENEEDENEEDENEEICIIETLDEEFLTDSSSENSEDERKKKKEALRDKDYVPYSPDESDEISSDSESDYLSDYYSLDGDQLQFRKTCRKCQQVLTCPSDYLRHMVKVHRKRVKDRKRAVDVDNAGDAGVPVKCTQCSEEFVSLKDRAEHFKAVHLEHEEANKRHLCPHCLKTYSSRHCWILHIQEFHVPEKSQLCTACGAAFFSRRRLLLHSLVHDPRERYICDYCKAPFRRKTYLTRHIFRTHTDDLPLLCTVCGRGFKSKQHLRIHLRTHTGDRPFACGVCPYRAAQSTNLLRHRQRHGPPTHPCPHCDRQFYCASTLRSHLRNHTDKQHLREDENQYACTQCQRSFGTSVQRTMHLQREHGFGRGSAFDGVRRKKQKRAKRDSSDGRSKQKCAREDSSDGQTKQNCVRKAAKE